MGIDIYAIWHNQLAEEKEAQYTGFDVTCGHFGYLREAYHGGPYATEVLVPEAFDHDYDAQHTDGPQIPAERLRERLPETLKTVYVRQKCVYGKGREHEMTEKIAQSFIDFVELCEAKERTTNTPCRICASY